MSDIKFYPNRVRAQCSTAGTDWQIVATDGVGYATYQLLLDAGKTKMPGSVTDLPRGVPRLLVRSVGANGIADGSAFSVATNTLSSPPTPDDVVSGSGQTLIYEDADVTSVWVKKSVSGDIIQLTGFY